MIGGALLDIEQVPSAAHGTLFRLWIVDSRPPYWDSVYVHTLPYTVGPRPGDVLWWQSGTIYWDSDRQKLPKIGYSGGRPKNFLIVGW